jgi:hypothetical protein
MNITFGKLILLLFVVLGVVAVASVMSSPEFQQFHVARPSWF